MAKMTMTSMERVMAAIQGREFDVYPAINPTSVATIDAIKIANAGFPTAHTNAAEMAALAAVGHDYFKFDTVSPYFSVHLEASALGAQIDWGDAGITPHVMKFSMSCIDDFVPPNSFLSQKEPQALLKACKLLKSKYGRNVPVIGKVIGPWTLAYNLYGVGNLVLSTILEPEKTKSLIKELSVIPLEFAKAQFDAGADIVTWAEHATSDLVSAKIYEEFIMPIHKQASFTLQSYGPMILHICGNVMDRLNYIANTGFKIFHMDSRNDIATAITRVGEGVRIVGCINNPVTLAQSTSDAVRKEVIYNLRCGVQLIAPECALPCNVPTENLRELVETVHRYSPQDVLPD